LHDLIQRLAASYQASLQSGGYPYIVLLMALESSVVPIPSEVIIPPAVLLVLGGQSRMTLVGIVIAAVIGSWIGASIMYVGARAAGRPLVVKYGRLVRITPEKIEGAERWSARFGSFGIFLSRMLPVVRHLIGIPAGIVRMNPLTYSVYTVLGSAFWCFILARVSVAAGHDQALMSGEIHAVTRWVVGAVVVLGAAYYFMVHRYARKTA
jgi:membrane protein DedA with SNARE-associated domain